jgi:hypothetical protein
MMRGCQQVLYCVCSVGTSGQYIYYTILSLYLYAC